MNTTEEVNLLLNGLGKPSSITGFLCTRVHCSQIVITVNACDKKLLKYQLKLKEEPSGELGVKGKRGK